MWLFLDVLTSFSKFSEKAMTTSYLPSRIICFASDSSEKLVKGIYERTDSEISKREQEIARLEDEIAKLKKDEIPYSQITREAVTQYPEIKDLFISRGAEVSSDSLAEKPCVLVVAKSEKQLGEAAREKLADWLKVRLNDTTVVVINKIN